VGIISITKSAKQIEQLARTEQLAETTALVTQMAIDLGNLETYLATRNS
jgi:hypothetical protein